MYDLKIVNGKVVDYRTKQLKNWDIGIVGGKIVGIGVLEEDSKKIIDAEQKIVSPGFIDIHMHEDDIQIKVDNDYYDIANKMALMGVTTAHGGNCGINIGDPMKFIEFVYKNGSPINYVMSIGYNSLREKIGITDNYREANDEEIKKICTIIKDYIDLGIVGLSFGIEYSPGITLSEMKKVCESILDRNLFISAHYRSDADKSIESIKELISLARITNLPLQISHLGSCTAMGMMKESLDLIQDAIDEGIDITADCYPYNAFSTFLGSAIFDDGCFERWNKSYDSILLTEGKYTGIRCSKEIFHKARKENPGMLAVAFVMNEEEVSECIRAPFVFVGSDGLYNSSQGHPRGAGTFPRLIGKFVREYSELSLIDALEKITYLPARKLGLKNKGKIDIGMDADLVIFDLESIIDTATFEQPTKAPEGIEYVIIQGEIAVKNKIQVNKRLGRFIRRNQ